MKRTEIRDRLSLSKTTPYAWIRAGKFPSHELEHGTVRRAHHRKAQWSAVNNLAPFEWLRRTGRIPGWPTRASAS